MKKIPTISKEQAEEFTQNAASLVHIGYKNILWADNVGIPTVLGYESLRDWVTDKLGGYIRYPIEERREIAKELRANGKSKTAIGEILGVNDGTIGRDLAAKGEPLQKRKSPKKRNSSEQQPKEDQPKDSKIRSEADLRPRDWDKGPSEENIRWAAEEGLAAIVWDKVRDRLEPVLIEVLQCLEEDEISVLADAIQTAIQKIQIR
jgi:transposase